MRQTPEAVQQHLAERLCWQAAYRDDSRVARRLDHKHVVDGVYHIPLAGDGSPAPTGGGTAEASRRLLAAISAALGLAPTTFGQPCFSSTSS